MTNNQIMPIQLLLAFIIAIVFLFAMTAYTWLSAMYWPDVPFLMNLMVQTSLVIGLAITVYKVLNGTSK